MPTHGSPSKGRYRTRSGHGISSSGLRVVVDTTKIQWPDALVMETLLTGFRWSFQYGTVGVSVPGIGFKEASDNAKKAYSLWRVWALSYADAYGTYGDPPVHYQMCRADWRIFRHTIPLQCRLIVEQVFYDLGWPWNSMCSGFSPLKG